MSTVVMLCFAAIAMFYGWTSWVVYEKADQPGWASLIPIYNGLVMLDIARKPRWWFWLYLVPLVNIVIGFKVVFSVARNFGKSTGFGVGLALLGFIFWPILAFGDAEYVTAEATLAA